MHAETAYLFRHGLLRDAAYELQPPLERGVLHRIALEIMEGLYTATDLEPLAIELAEHARFAAEAAPDTAAGEALQDTEVRYLEVGVELLKRTWQVTEELLVREHLANHPRVDPATRRRHLNEAQDRALKQGDLRRARRLAQEYLERSRAAKDTGDETRALLALAEAKRRAGLDWKSDVSTQTLMERAENMGLEERLTAMRLREIEVRDGHDLATATKMLERSLDVARKAGLQRWEAALLGQLAHDYLANGERERALEMAMTAVQIAETAGEKHMLASCKNHLGIIYIETGDLQSAERAYGEARQLAHEIGAYGLELTIAVNAGNLQLYFLGNLELAEREYLLALDSAYERGAVEDAIATLIRLSALYMVKDDSERSYQQLTEVVRLAQRVGAPAAELAAKVQMCRCRAPLTPQQRLETGIEGIRLARAHGKGRAEGEAWAWIAMMLTEQGAFDAAKQAAACSRRAVENVPAGYAFGLHAQATRGLAALLTGQVEEARTCAREFLAGVGPNSPHHRVAKGEIVLLAAAMQEAAGLVGTKPIPAETHTAISAKRNAMWDALKDSQLRQYGAPRDALACADELAQLIETDAPYSLLYGVTPDFLTVQQLDAILRRMQVERPDDLNKLEKENLKLWAIVDNRRSQGWPAWNARLEELPGVTELLADAD